MLSTDQKGAVAESAIVHEAIKLGIGVLKPLCEGERYDLVFDLRPSLVRVQCKWASRSGDLIIVRCYRSRRTRKGILQRRYSIDEIDAVAAYCLELDRCFYFPMSWLGGRATVQLRLGLPRNNQRAGVNWADDFDFQRLQSPAQGP